MRVHSTQLRQRLPLFLCLEHKFMYTLPLYKQTGKIPSNGIEFHLILYQYKHTLLIYHTLMFYYERISIPMYFSFIIPYSFIKYLHMHVILIYRTMMFEVSV